MNLEKIRQSLSRPLVAAGVGFLIGLIIGLPVLGWGVFPVQWTDAAPRHLREDLKIDYLRMAIESYAVDQDPQLAYQRWQELGPDAQSMLETLATDPKLQAKDIVAFRGVVMTNQALQPAMTTPAEGQPTQAEAVLQSTQATSSTFASGGTPTAEKKSGGITSWFIILGVFCLLTLIIGGALFYILVIKKRTLSTENIGAQFTGKHVEEEINEEGKAPPTAQFVTTYMLGDDLYDDSFSIDSATGEFLGECGVGISDVVGVGDPKKVTAFEVWLFDKNDIQTVTKVLMSEHAYNDSTIRQRLLSKGEPVLIQPNERILLETATLQLEARVIDLNYGQSALPVNSYFERLSLELAVWPRA